MFERVTKQLAPPVFADEDKTRVARLLNVMLLAVAGTFVGLALFDPLIQSEPLPTIILSLCSVAIVLFLRRQLFRGEVRSVAKAFSVFALLLVTAASVLFGGMTGPCDSVFVVVVLIGGFFVSSRFAVVMAILSMAIALALTIVEDMGLLPPPVSPVTPIIHWTTLAVAILFASVLLHLAVRSINDALVSSRRNERLANDANRELRDEASERERAQDELRERRRELEELNQQLEQRVAERTAALSDKLQLIEQQQSAIEQLSVPVIQVWQEVLMLPIVGAMDARRSENMTESLLGQVVETQARFVIIDITGVDVVDTQTASVFGKMVTAVELLGARVIVTGISPHVAQTLTDLGADLGNVSTRRNLQAGLKETLARLRRDRVNA